MPRKTRRSQRGGVTNANTVKPTTVGILIGRFQPLHKAHLETILTGLQKEDRFVVCIGRDPIGPKNPYSVETRKEFIIGAVLEAAPALINKLEIDVLPEAPEDGNWATWYSKFYAMLKTKQATTTKLYACGKDGSTAAYLDKILADNSYLVRENIAPGVKGNAIIGATDIIKIMKEFTNALSNDYEQLITRLRDYLPNYVLISIIGKLTGL
jgi:cytidyltransferase-like protein